MKPSKIVLFSIMLFSSTVVLNAMKSATGSTRLIDAIKTNDHAQIYSLINSSLINEPDEMRNTPLMWAAKQNNADIVHALLCNCHIKVNARNIFGFTALMQTSDITIIKELLEHDADVNATSFAGLHTAIQLAAYKGHVDVVHTLLFWGASTKAIIPESEPPLVAAARGSIATKPEFKLLSRRHYLAITQELLAQGANVNDQNHFQQTALHIAAADDEELANELLRRDARVNIQDKYNHTALMIAAQHGQLSIVKTLVEQYHADVTLKDIDGKTAKDLAIEKHHSEIVDYLAWHGG